MTSNVKHSQGFSPSVSEWHNCCCSVYPEVGDERLIPASVVTEKKDGIPVHTITYGTVPTEPFVINIELERVSRRVTYAARVFVWEQGEQQECVNETAAVPDHILWVGSSVTRYTMRGFYRTSDKLRRFKFSEGQPEVPAEGHIQCDWNHGSVSILLSKHSCPISPLQSRGYVTVQPGTTIESGSWTSLVASLKKETMFKVRVLFMDYNTMRLSPMNPFSDPSNFRAIPLYVFFIHVNRTLLMYTIVRKVQVQREEAAEPGDGHEQEGGHKKRSALNDFVATADLVRYVNRCLSPTAAFLLCTGKHKDFGEKLVQREEPIENDPHFEEKLKGLHSFFEDDPDTFIFEEYGQNHEGQPLTHVQVAPIDIV